MSQKDEDSMAVGSVLALALKQFAATLHKQSEQQSGVVDVFASAIRELGVELQKTKVRCRALEARLEQAEGRVEHLEQVVSALTRQGWIH